MLILGNFSKSGKNWQPELLDIETNQAQILDLAFTYPSRMLVKKTDGRALEKVIQYCTNKDLHYKRKECQRVELSRQHRDYLSVDGAFLCQILTGANFLNIPGLLDITSQCIADMIKGKSVDEMRGIYQLPDDLTPEEKEEMKKRYEWLDV